MSEIKLLITQDELKRLFYYDPNIGDFIRLTTRSSNAVRGAKAGSISCEGYIHINIGKRIYKAHRLAWLYVYGSFPNGVIDHINCDKQDNRIANLRDTTFRMNIINCGIRKNNTTGYKGVHFSKKLQRWTAQIDDGKRQVHLGCFDSPEEASLAYQNKAREIHGQYARF